MEADFSFQLLGTQALIFNLIIHLLMAWGLYNINKKLGEPAPWLAWIPVIQIYSFVKAAGKNGIWVLWLILGFIFFLIPGIIIFAILCSEISKRTGNGIGTTLGIFFISPIMLPIVGAKLDKDNISKVELETKEL